MNSRRKKLTAYPQPYAPPRPRAAGSPLWEIAIYGDLTDKQPDLVGKLLDVPRHSRGIIYFDSSGGSVYVGLGLASLIRLRGLQVSGVVVGECSSAAILPLAACTKRYVTPHVTLLFHPMRWHSEENVRLEEATEWARHFRVIEEDLDNLLSRMLDFPLEKLAEWTRPGRYVTGKEFAEAGLAEMVDLFSGDIVEQMRRTV